MIKRPLFCDACASETEHLIDESDNDGEDMALCSRCGRLQPLPHDENKRAPASQQVDSRTR